MFKDSPRVNAYFGRSGGYESRLEHLNHIVRSEAVQSKQFPPEFGVDFSQPLAHVTNEFLTVATGTRLQRAREEEERRVAFENASLVRRLGKYDTAETRLKHHALLAAPHDEDHFFSFQGSNAFGRSAEGARIDAANASLARRLVAVKPSVCSDKIRKDVARHDKLVKQLSKFAKGAFVTTPASPRAVREMRMLEQQQQQQVGSSGGGSSPLSPSAVGRSLTGAVVLPPPLYKCSPAEAKAAAIGATPPPPHMQVSSRASPFPETALFTQERLPYRDAASASASASAAANANDNGGINSPTRTGAVGVGFTAFGESPTRGGSSGSRRGGASSSFVAFQEDEAVGGGGGGGTDIEGEETMQSQRAQPRRVKRQQQRNNNKAKSTASPSSPSAAAAALTASGGKLPWQSPSVDDIRAHYYTVDASVRRASPTKKELSERHRIVTNQAFYRRGEGSITLLGLYKSNSERMAALSAATASAREARSGRSNQQQQAHSARVGGAGPNYFGGGGDPPSSPSSASSSPSQQQQRPRSFSVLNAAHRTEAHSKAAPRKNHQSSSKRNVVRDAAEEHMYTSRSVYALHNDTDPEPPEMTFGAHSGSYGEAKVCSKGCYRSHHKQLKEWRATAAEVEAQRRRENAQFSIANQLEIQRAKRRLVAGDDDTVGGIGMGSSSAPSTPRGQQRGDRGLDEPCFFLAYPVPQPPAQPPQHHHQPHYATIANMSNSGRHQPLVLPMVPPSPRSSQPTTPSANSGFVPRPPPPQQ